MATFIFTLLLTILLLIRGSETRQSKEEALWVVRQVVTLPAEEVVIQFIQFTQLNQFIQFNQSIHNIRFIQVVIYIDPEVEEEKKEESVVISLANTSRRETKTATLPIVMGVVGGVMFAFASLLAVLCLRPIR